MLEASKEGLATVLSRFFAKTRAREQACAPDAGSAWSPAARASIGEGARRQYREDAPRGPTRPTFLQRVQPSDRRVRMRVRVLTGRGKGRVFVWRSSANVRTAGGRQPLAP